MAGAFESRVDEEGYKRPTGSALNVFKFLKGEDKMTPEEARRKLAKKDKGLSGAFRKYVTFINGLING